jgi:large subunit ribosomal protein L21
MVSSLFFMSKIAVIKTGGKQYKVKEGDKLQVEKLPEKTNGKVEFTEILLVADSESGIAKVGTPLVTGMRVSAEIIEHGRTKKIKVVKYKPKTRYKKVHGHRQHYSKVKITKISQ